MKRLRVLLLSALLAAPALAQSPNVLSAAQVAVFDALMVKAKATDPTYLHARAREIGGRQEAAPLSAVNATGSVSLGTSGGFDQVTSGARLAVSVDLKQLVQNVKGMDRAQAAQVDALTASTSAAARDLRVRVLEAFAAYLSAIRQAGSAADALEVARANLRQQTARAAAGAATGVDVLRAGQEQNRADAELYDANLRLAVAKQRLSAVCGVTLSELDALMGGAKPRP